MSQPHQSAETSPAPRARDWYGHWQAVDVGIARGPRDERQALVQVGKTLLGKPIPQGQLRLLGEHIRRVLQLMPSHRCLDLGCGNGLLTTMLAGHVRAVTAIDYSRPLLQVARAQFAAPNVAYLRRDVTTLHADWVPAGHFGRAWSCELLQHLSPAGTARLFHWLGRHMGPGGRVLFAGIPEQERLRAFYNTDARYARYRARVASGTEQIGTWWQPRQLRKLAITHGMRATRLDQPPDLYTSHYRFDLLLERPE